MESEHPNPPETDEERAARHERERIESSERYERERKESGDRHESERLAARAIREHTTPAEDDEDENGDGDDED